MKNLVTNAAIPIDWTLGNSYHMRHVCVGYAVYYSLEQKHIILKKQKTWCYRFNAHIDFSQALEIVNITYANIFN